MEQTGITIDLPANGVDTLNVAPGPLAHRPSTFDHQNYYLLHTKVVVHAPHAYSMPKPSNREV